MEKLTSIEEKLEQEKNRIAQRANMEIIICEYLYSAFVHYFGWTGHKNLETAEHALQEACIVKTEENLPFSAVLARKMASTAMDANNLLRFYVPNMFFSGPFTKIDPRIYGYLEASAFICSIPVRNQKNIFREGVLIFPETESSPESLITRCSTYHPCVFGPLACTTNVKVIVDDRAKTYEMGLLFRKRSQFIPAKEYEGLNEGKKFLCFAKDVASGLENLHDSLVCHGNPGLENLFIEASVRGIICNVKIKNLAVAPESLTTNHFSFASDVFHFASSLLQLIIEDWKDSWLPNKELDERERLSRITIAAKSNYEILRKKLPDWCPKELAELLIQCLQEDPIKRPKMNEVALALKQIRWQFDLDTILEDFVDIKDKAKQSNAIPEYILRDAVSVYNMLNDMGKNGSPELVAKINTIQSLLLLRGYIKYLDKGSEYPNGPFVAVLSSRNLRKSEKHKAQAIYEHTALSDSTNPHRAIADSLLLARFFPTVRASLPTGLDLKQKADFRVFCDMMDELIEHRVEERVYAALKGQRRSPGTTDTIMDDMTKTFRFQMDRHSKEPESKREPSKNPMKHDTKGDSSIAAASSGSIHSSAAPGDKNKAKII